MATMRKIFVEVDEETGFIRVLRYITVDDCGRMLNPTVVEGQIHGGVAFGLGNTLWEEVLYDEDGQVQTGTYMDYLIPTASEIPDIKVGHQTYHSELNPLGVKGVGEGGAVSPPAAIANAVVDALRPLRVQISRVPELLGIVFRPSRHVTRLGVNGGVAVGPAVLTLAHDVFVGRKRARTRRPRAGAVGA